MIRFWLKLSGMFHRCVVPFSVHLIREHMQSICPVIGALNFGYLVKVIHQISPSQRYLFPFVLIHDVSSDTLRLCDYPVPQQSFIQCFSCFGIQW